MVKSQKDKAREGIERYKKMKKDAPKPKPKPKEKQGEKANWVGRLKAKLKVEFAKRAQKKAYKNLSAAEKRENFKTKRTSRYESSLKKAGVSEDKIKRLRGNK